MQTHANHNAQESSKQEFDDPFSEFFMLSEKTSVFDVSCQGRPAYSLIRRADFRLIFAVEAR